MALEQRIESLKKRHAYLDHVLHEEGIRPSADDLELRRIKREKLNLKDEMSRLISAREQAA